MNVNALAYYDGSKDEIHILSPKALYSRILEHELAHRRHRGFLRLVWTGQNFFSEPIGRMIIYGMGVGYVFYETPFLVRGISTLGPLPFLAGLVLAVLLLGSFMYWAEDLIAEQEAVQKSRHPKRSKPKITEPVPRITDGSPTVESNLPDPIGSEHGKLVHESNDQTDPLVES